ncbi:hypothetical protein GCM10027361_00650 [Erwinia aphidicola]
MGLQTVASVAGQQSIARSIHLSYIQSQSLLRFGLPQAAVEILIIKELDIVSVVRCVLLME